MAETGRFIARALALMSRAVHRTSPNPTVGCVIVKDAEIVGQGVTRPPGQAHAEIVALEQAGARARGADVYVTLEPCCHHGRTPPCTDALIRAGVARVFAGVIDPNPMVAGRGLTQLRAAGIEASLVPSDLAAGCEHAIAPFRRFIEDTRPWVLLKAAVSLDGRIATRAGDARWITGEAARRDGHRLRARADAVLVGGETLRRDNPRLTVRGVPGDDPIRVVVSTALDLPPEAVALGPGTHVFHGPDAPEARRRVLEAKGVLLHPVPCGAGGLDLGAVLRSLAEVGIVQLLVEGGGRVHGSLLGARLADEVCFYVAPRLLGEGRPAVAGLVPPTVAEAWTLVASQSRRFGPDVRIRGLIQYPGGSCSPV